MIRVISLDCWHANGIIYQADGMTSDGKHVYVHFRHGRLSVWIGGCAFEDSVARKIDGEWPIEHEPHPEGRPDTITRGTLAAWTEGRIEWPTRIDGFHNEPRNGGEDHDAIGHRPTVPAAGRRCLTAASGTPASTAGSATTPSPRGPSAAGG